MIFNSFEFVVFLPVVFALYWLLRRHLWWQNILVLAASYVFYGWWDWRFLFLIAFTSGCSYLSGLVITRNFGGGQAVTKVRKVALWGNVGINLAILGLFKYYNFFVGEFIALFGGQAEACLLNVVLPVGISFYTFQALSYTIDVYKGRISPTRDVVAFFAYISFFPQLVAGPIERATNLLPQFLRRRTFNYAQAVDGCRQMLWGLFKKMVVADGCAVYVDRVFETGGTGVEHLIAAALFAVQIYGDFSGYSDIAIGTAKLFGIRLMQNFRTPYFSRDIAEFWRRWHISLTTWFRDYLYIPLGGSRVGRWKVVRNTFVIFLVSGLWHGANWTFLAWGAYHACLFLPLILLGRNRRHTDEVATGRWLPTLREAGEMLLTFVLVTVGWVFFRAPDMGAAAEFFCQSFALSGDFSNIPVTALLFTVLMLAVEWVQRDKNHGFDLAGVRPAVARYACYAVLVAILFVFGVHNATFIYFQF